MHGLLRFVCLAYPSEFRKRYIAQIVGDFDEHHRQERNGPLYVMQLLIDVISSGLSMRMESVLRDVRNTVRRVRKTPLLASVIVLTFALGIGANIAVFSVLKAVLLQPLPYPNASRLVAIQQIDPRLGTDAQLQVSQLDLQDMLRSSTTLENAASYGEDGKTLTGSGKPVFLNISDVAWRFFATLGMRPELGRLFTIQDVRGSARATTVANPQGIASKIIVISDKLWHSKFGGSRDVIGRRVTLDGDSFTIIGVAPPGFKTPEPSYDGFFDADAFVVIPDRVPPNMRGARYLSAVALRRNGASIAATQADLTRIQHRLQQLYPRFENRTTIVKTLRNAILGDTMPALLKLIFAAVFGVFLIMCGNIASLLLTQANARDHEISMRVALGATRSRITTQLLTEAGVLAAAGAAVGVIAAYFGLRFFISLGSAQIPRLNSASVDLPVVLYAVALSVAATLISGAAPSWILASTRSPILIRSARRPASANKRAQSALVVAEIAIALALVTASGLTLRSLYALTHANLGIRVQGVLASDNFVLVDRRFPTVDAKRQELRRIQAGISDLPGTTAALATSYPMSGSLMAVAFGIAGQHYAPGASPDAELLSVTPQYFNVFGMTLRRGRAFTAGDRKGSAPIAIVNAAFAKYLPQGKDPIGVQIRMNVPNDPTGPQLREIVGVVSDVRDGPFSQIQPQIYVPLDQAVLPWITAVAYSSSGDSSGLRTAITSAFASADPLAQAPAIQTMAEVLGYSAGAARLSAALFASLGLIALCLAVAGVFGVISYSVTQRYQEFGIRMAIGSSAAGVIRAVLGGFLLLAGCGIAAGLVLSAIGGHAMGPQLYDVQPSDPLVFAVVTIVIVAAALLAAALPTLRAARIDPAVALRYE